MSVGDLSLLKDQTGPLEGPLPGVDVSRTVQPNHSMVSRTSLFLALLWDSLYFGNVPTATGSSYASLCKRGRHGCLGCGAHGVKIIASNAGSTHRTESWSLRTA